MNQQETTEQATGSRSSRLKKYQEMRDNNRKQREKYKKDMQWRNRRIVELTAIISQLQKPEPELIFKTGTLDRMIPAIRKVLKKQREEMLKKALHTGKSKSVTDQDFEEDADQNPNQDV